MSARLLKAGALVAILLLAAGCNEKSSFSDLAKHGKPHISSKTLAEMKKQGMPLSSPVVARVFKEESKVEIWKQKSNGRYGLLATYDICKYSGQLGPKFTEGDRQAPEGFYTVRPAQMNPNSQYHLSFDIGYPNAFDRAHGRTGSNLMVHGACSSSGCYSMTDPQIEEIYAIARESFKGGQQEFQIQAYPFRMTAANMARYHKDPNFAFWKNLKEGYDMFEITKVPPKVDVCEKRYVFNMNVPLGTTMSPTGACPAGTVPDTLSSAYQSYQQKYEAAFASSIGKGPAPKDSINGIQEANLVKDWTKRRARGERISMEPPSIDANGNVVVTSQMGRANTDAGRRLAAAEAEQAAKQQEAEAKKRAEEQRAAQIAEAKRLKEEQAKAAAEAAEAPTVESTAAIAPLPTPAAETATAEAVAEAPAGQDGNGMIGNVRKRLGKLFGG
ncbi:MAG: murein L,D-transpeptidase [Rhizobiaceae bacterium]|nr:murein L,D-transpeptidase [Rhizobiaceae bacterium]